MLVVGRTLLQYAMKRHLLAISPHVTLVVQGLQLQMGWVNFLDYLLFANFFFFCFIEMSASG